MACRQQENRDEPHILRLHQHETEHQAGLELAAAMDERQSTHCEGEQHVIPLHDRGLCAHIQNDQTEEQQRSPAIEQADQQSPRPQRDHAKARQRDERGDACSLIQANAGQRLENPSGQRRADIRLEVRGAVARRRVQQVRLGGSLHVLAVQAVRSGGEDIAAIHERDIVAVAWIVDLTVQLADQKRAADEAPGRRDPRQQTRQG